MGRKKYSHLAIYVFFIISILNLLEQLVHTGWMDLATKPFIIITLLLYYQLSKSEKSNSFSKFITGALIFSWIGDILLMLQGQIKDVFIFGLASFLVAHLCYILAFRKARFDAPNETSNSYVHARIVFLIFVGGALIFMLRPNLNQMLIPVISYTIVIVAMGIAALLRKGWTRDQSFVLTYGGALLFILSDAMLGINRFMNPFAQAPVLIMATYIAAQFLIVKGMLSHEKKLTD